MADNPADQPNEEPQVLPIERVPSICESVQRLNETITEFNNSVSYTVRWRTDVAGDWVELQPTEPIPVDIPYDELENPKKKRKESLGKGTETKIDVKEVVKKRSTGRRTKVQIEHDKVTKDLKKNPKIQRIKPSV